MSFIWLQTFQSLIGRLKTVQRGASSHVLPEFQSLIGRLKTLVGYRGQNFLLEVFQSLIGRLKTDKTLRIEIGILMFQSLIGRLKTSPSSWSSPFWGVVSIPHR